MGVVRLLLSSFRATRAENVSGGCRKEKEVGARGSHGFAEDGDPMHLGEGPP